MSTLAEIEAVLPKLSPEELARVEAALRRLRRGRDADVRFDGQPWPSSHEELAALLDQVDALPSVLTPADAERFEAWLAVERERQKALFQNGGANVRTLFP